MNEARPVKLRFASPGPEFTRALGASIGSVAEAGDVFLLEGEFGAGKTVFVQGLAEGLAVMGYVASPSFVIMNQHPGRLMLYHIDLYRAEQLDPELEATIADAFDSGGVTAVEWSNIVEGELRQGASVVRVSHGEGNERMIELVPAADRLAQAAQALGSFNATRD